MIALAALIVEADDPPAIPPVEQAILEEMRASFNGFGNPPENDLDDRPIRQHCFRPFEKHGIHVGIYAIILAPCRETKNPGRFRPGFINATERPDYFVAAS